MKKLMFLTTIFLLASCQNRNSDYLLRGEVEPSKDGKTYFGFIDDGGECGETQLLFDGKEWMQPLGEVVLVKPGAHEVQCGVSIGFMIPEGVVYKFDYWGP